MDSSSSAPVSPLKLPNMKAKKTNMHQNGYVTVKVRAAARRFSRAVLKSTAGRL